MLRRTERDIVINVKRLHVKYPLFLSDFNETGIFTHLDGQTDIHDEANK